MCYLIVMKEGKRSFSAFIISSHLIRLKVQTSVGCIVCKYFLLFHRLSLCCFFFFKMSFAVQKLFHLIRSHLFIFAFVSITLGDGYKKILQQFLSESVLPVFASRIFRVFSLIFRFLILCEFVFVYGVKECSNFIILCVAVQFC